MQESGVDGAEGCFEPGTEYWSIGRYLTLSTLFKWPSRRRSVYGSTSIMQVPQIHVPFFCMKVKLEWLCF